MTPIDNSGSNLGAAFEPDRTNGRLPAQDESNDTEMRKRRRNKKKVNKSQ